MDKMLDFPIANLRKKLTVFSLLWISLGIKRESVKVGILEFFCHILISISFTDSMYIHELNQEDVQDVPYPGIDISIKSLFLNKCQKMSSPPPKKWN